MTPAIILALAAATSSAAVTATSRYAVVIGHNHTPDPERASLRYADDDAARFYELLAPTLQDGALLAAFDDESQRTFASLIAKARPPTRAMVEATIEAFKSAIAADRSRGQRTELYFFYAGHGDVDDGVGYVNLADDRMTRDDFKRLILAEPRADATHVFVDACKSYFFVAGRGPGGERRPQVAAFAGPDRTPGVGYVLSTSNDSESHEWSAFGGGIFAHEILSALAGGGDIDGDGRVDYEELAAFVAVANESIPYPRYRPSVYVRPPVENAQGSLFEPAALPGATQLEIGAAAQGRLTLFDERGVRYADVNKGPGTRLQLALLEPRRYEARWDGRRYSVSTSTPAVSLASLTPDGAYTAGRGEIHRAFQSLFSAPLSADVLRGYRLGLHDPAADHAVVSDPERELPWWSYGLTGAGVAAIAGGVVLTILAANERAAILNASQVERPELDSAADRLAVGAGVSFGVGLTALAAGLYTVLAD